MGRGELALDFLIQFCREPTHHCQEGESPPLLLLTLIYGDWGSCPDSWPRTSPLLELMLVSSRVISVPLEVSVLASGYGSGSDSVQGPGSPESCWSPWRSCCQLSRCWCPGPGKGGWVGCKGARPHRPGGGPAAPPGAPLAPFSSLHCAPSPVPRRTCCLLLSALKPSLPLPLVVARAVGASPQDYVPACREQPWVSSGCRHGTPEVKESSPPAPAGLSLGCCWLH